MSDAAPFEQERSLQILFDRADFAGLAAVMPQLLGAGNRQVVVRSIQQLEPLLAANARLDEPTRNGIEDALTGLLQHYDAAIQRAAAHALGDWGTTRAMEPLGVTGAGPMSRDLKRVADAAREKIRERHGGARPGRLSLADDRRDVGQLSLGQNGELTADVGGDHDP